MAIQFPLQDKLNSTLSNYATQESLEELDGRVTEVSNAARSYADSGDDKALASAKDYTDDAIASSVGEAFSFAPDYINIVRSNVLDASHSWTADKDGFLLVSGYAQNGAEGGAQFKVTINYYTEHYFQAAVNVYNVSTIIEVSKGDKVVVECTYGDAASASLSASYIPPKVVPVPTATEVSYVPDYSGMETTSLISVRDGTWIADRDGYVSCEIQIVNNGAGLIQVNGNTVANGGANTNNRVCDMIPVSVGDEVKLTTDIASGFYSCYCYFVPPKAIIPPTMDVSQYAKEQELQDHIGNDGGYWQTVLQVQNITQANQALLTQQQTTINDLLVRVAALENAPIADPPSYDMSNPTTLKTPPLLGALGIEIGGINNIGSGWTAPSSGLIVVDGASLIGALTPTWIAVNGTKVDPSSSTAILSLIGGGSSGQFTVAEGDIITEDGMGNVTFYPEIQ